MNPARLCERPQADRDEPRRTTPFTGAEPGRGLAGCMRGLERMRWNDPA
jgi:hypothetical protein